MLLRVTASELPSMWRTWFLAFISCLIPAQTTAFRAGIPVLRNSMPSNAAAMAQTPLRYLGTRRSIPFLHMSAEDEDGLQPARPSSSVKVSFPTPDQGADMGIREWPGFLKKDSDFDEDVEIGTVRYVLEGKGICTPAGETPIEMVPGTLLECQSSTTLTWKVSTPLVILTPRFEQPGFLAAGALALFGGLGWLLANVKDTKAVKKPKEL